MSKKRYVECFVSDIVKAANPNAAPYHKDLANDYYEVDGFSVNEALFRFAQTMRLTRGFRDCKFGRPSDRIHSDFMLFVYFAEDLYPVGGIGYSDFSKSASVGSKFAVFSRNINNEKYSWGSFQCHMRSSVNMHTAMKIARSHLVRHSTGEVVSKDIPEFAERLVGACADLKGKTNLAEAGLLQDGTLLNELLVLRQANYAFINKEINTKIDDFLEKRAARDQLMDEKYVFHIVIVHNGNMEGKCAHGFYPQPVRLGSLLTQRAYSHVVSENLQRLLTGVETVETTVAALPLEISGKLQSLNMLPLDEFVNGVGFRHTANMFFVMESVDEDDDEADGSE